MAKHGGCLTLLIGCLFGCNLAWSLSFSSKDNNMYDGRIQRPTQDRRQALAEIGSISAALTGGFLIGSEKALAGDVESLVEPLPFTTYNIIPDAGVDLSPKLKVVDNMKLIKQITHSKTGSSVWLGEHHNSAIDHNFQEQFIRMLHKENTKIGRKEQPMAVGLEQVQVQFQPILDDYVSGKISLEDMRRLVEWDKRWMWSFDGYKGIFEAARELGNVRLLALNVDSEDLAKVEKGGYPNLPMGQLRKYIRDPIGFGNFANAKQFKTYVDYVIEPSYEIHQNLGLLKYTIAGEKLDSEMSFRNFLSGRILWDEGMASAAYSWVTETNGLLVGLVGADHVKFQNGIPGRFARLSTKSNFECTTVVINPTLIDSRPSGSVSNLPGSDSAKTPESITLQLRYLRDDIDSSDPEARKMPESTGGVLPFADYIVVT